MMLIGSRSRPRPTGSRSHRLILTPVRDAGRCGRGSGGRLAGFGGDGQLRLTGSRAIPRGSGRRPCWGVRAALVRGCAAATVGQVCHSLSPGPPTDRVSFKRQDAAATRSSVLRPVGLPQPPCPAAGPAATEELPAPGAACRGGAGRERGPEA